MSERTYCIIGTGALGGYYGARLHHAGNPVGFLLRSDYQHVREHGLKVDSKHGDFSIAQPRIYASPAEIEPADVAVVSLKTTHNHLLPEILPHAVKSGGSVLVMQNGLNVEADVAAVLPDVPIVSGLAFLCSNKIGPGHIRHLDYGQVRLGQWSAEGEAMGVTQLVRDIAADFQRAGLRVELEDDLLL
ncbi:MAG: 2-dehydropantoate 2-reductase N-terminal domain-containing protein, partial [Phycisphaeraceae bacterium]